MDETSQSRAVSNDLNALRITSLLLIALILKIVPKKLRHIYLWDSIDVIVLTLNALKIFDRPGLRLPMFLGKTRCIFSGNASGTASDSSEESSQNPERGSECSGRGGETLRKHASQRLFVIQTLKRT